ncbi:hypothetical protein C1H46_030748 [Malus baccata]|uniref:Uncharacterized protein n=1 Tax=Malus baccata TaxID=106549 RepID=A0A540LB64_MALBA|nr:hypothetical protein C1H46_030748 [Malus baccata]
MASNDEIKKTQEKRKRMEKQLASLSSVTFDTDLYGGTNKGAYILSILVNDDDDNAEDGGVVHGPQVAARPVCVWGEDSEPVGEDLCRCDEGGSPKREKEETLKLIAKKMKEKEEAPPENEDKPAAEAVPQKRRNRWDQSQDGDGGARRQKRQIGTCRIRRQESGMQLRCQGGFRI